MTLLLHSLIVKRTLQSEVYDAVWASGFDHVFPFFRNVAESQKKILQLRLLLEYFGPGLALRERVEPASVVAQRNFLKRGERRLLSQCVTNHLNLQLIELHLLETQTFQ